MRPYLPRAGLWSGRRKHRRDHRPWRRERLRVKGLRCAKRKDLGLWSLDFDLYSTMRLLAQRVQVQRPKSKDLVSSASTPETRRCSLSSPTARAQLPSAQWARADSGLGA